MIASVKFTTLRGWDSAWTALHPKVSEILSQASCINADHDLGPAEAYRDAMVSWIDHGRNLNWSGCQHKKQWAYTNGIHDAIVHQVSYNSHSVDRFYCMSDDYRFYQTILKTHRHSVIGWQDIDGIGENGYVLVSWPNHNGVLDGKLDRLAGICRERGTRIFLDCAFYGTVAKGVCDTSDDVFDAVAFSVSKAFRCNTLRAGLVWGDDLAPTMTIPMDPRYRIYNETSARMATRLIRRLPADFVPDVYEEVQKEFCLSSGFERSDICMFALCRESAYSGWFRSGSDYLRVCISDLLEKTFEEWQSRDAKAVFLQNLYQL